MSEEVIIRHAKDSGTDFLMYTGNFCGYCEAAKRLFKIKNLKSGFLSIDFDVLVAVVGSDEV